MSGGELKQKYDPEERAAKFGEATANFCKKLQRLFP